MTRKPILIFTMALLLGLLAFFAYSWRFAVHLGWDGESPTGYYRFRLVVYETVDYGRPSNTWVMQDLGNTWDAILYIAGHKPKP